MKKYYDTHHKQFEESVKRNLEIFNKCLIIDGHSFYDRPLPYEYNQDSVRPDICVGTDDFHTSAYLSEYFVDEFSKRGYSVGINVPFAGTIVPMKYYQRDRRVESVMIEVNRKLYIDRMANKSQNYERVRKDIRDILNNIKGM